MFCLFGGPLGAFVALVCASHHQAVDFATICLAAICGVCGSQVRVVRTTFFFGVEVLALPPSPAFLDLPIRRNIEKKTARLSLSLVSVSFSLMFRWRWASCTTLVPTSFTRRSGGSGRS